MEGFNGNSERPKSSESFEDWRTLKMEAPRTAWQILRDRGLTNEIERATHEEIVNLCRELPSLIEEYSYNADGSVQNENRYVVEALARILHAVNKRREYEEALAEAA